MKRKAKAIKIHGGKEGWKKISRSGERILVKEDHRFSMSQNNINWKYQVDAKGYL